jgi:hypothetical protein
MTDRRQAVRDGEIDKHAPESSCAEPKVLRFPDRVQRQPRRPARIDDPDGSDPGPSAA